MATLPQICTEGHEIWTARVPLISWRRVEWHLPDRVMRQFGGIQSTDILPIERGFRRVDGRGKADIDWMHYYAAYIALWNDRRRYITEIIPPRDDGEREYKLYLRWYKSWATLYVLQPSGQPPSTYYPRAPDQRIAVDYIVRTRALARPFEGGHGENASSMQMALTEIGQLASRIGEQLHIDFSAYDISQSPSSSNAPRRSTSEAYGRSPVFGSERSNPDGRRHSTYIGSTEYSVPSAYAGEGPSSMWPSSSQQYGEPFTSMPASLPYPPLPMMYSMDISSGPTDEDIIFTQSAPPTTQQQAQEEEEEEEEEQQLLPRRTHRAPTRYSPGSNAIPRIPRTRRRT